jgi:sugar O-acyltransferase (sialic acid O-acetyltransferase NeuD family)
VSKPGVLIWGGKSQAHILHEMILELELGVPRIIFDYSLNSPEFSSNATFTNGIENLHSLVNGVDKFVVGIGGSHGFARHETGKALEKKLDQLNVISKNSFIDTSVSFGKGLQVMPGAIVHKFVILGKNVILNTGSTIDHDCKIGDGVHIMGSAAIAGNVTIEDFATIGTNSTILPNLKIGWGAYIGAGAVVTQDVEPNSVYVGVPARKIRENVLELNRKILEEFNLSV